MVTRVVENGIRILESSVVIVLGSRGEILEFKILWFSEKLLIEKGEGVCLKINYYNGILSSYERGIGGGLRWMENLTSQVGLGIWVVLWLIQIILE